MKRIILITNVDSYFGYSLAFELLKLNLQNTEFRLLCHERQLTSELSKRGGQVIELASFQDKIKLNPVLRDVNYVILVPENSLQSFAEGRALIECARQNRVGYLAMLSFVGIDQLKIKMPYLSQYFDLEQEISKNFNNDSYCIFRSTLWHQFFYYFAPMMESQNKVQLILDKKVQWGTVDMKDLLEAIIQLSEDEGCQENRTLFEFTPSHTMTTQEIVQAASEALGMENMTYEQVDSSVLCNYLTKIHDDDRFKERPNHLFPLGQYLNHHLIQVIVEYLQLTNQLQEIKTSHDLEDNIQSAPILIKEFFKQHKDQFQHLK